LVMFLTNLKIEQGSKVRKWHHDCILNHEMELTWNCPLHGSVAIVAKTVVKRVDGTCSFWAGFHRPGIGHNMITIEQGL
jgi:hypothetical protein